MKYVFYDTETSGLYSKKREVLQFSAILTDEDFIPKTVCNFYCDTVIPIEPGAIAIHGLTHEKLHLLSGGRTFEDNFLELEFLQDKDLIWIGWGSAYDKSVINSTLTNNGIPAINFGDKINVFNKQSGVHNADLMYMVSSILNNGIKMKLENAAKSISFLSHNDLNAMYSKISTIANQHIRDHLNETKRINSLHSPEELQLINSLLVELSDKTSGAFHDSLYDTFITWALAKQYGPAFVMHR